MSRHQGWWAISDEGREWSKETALELSPPHHKLWPSFVFTIFWLLWLNRNEQKHNGESLTRPHFRNKMFLELERAATRQYRLGKRKLARWWLRKVRGVPTQVGIYLLNDVWKNFWRERVYLKFVKVLFKMEIICRKNKLLIGARSARSTQNSI